MPTPIIELQRRLSPVGAIRIGGEKEPNRPGRKLEAVRLTSPRKQLIEQAAELYGGTVTPWQSPVGPEFQVYTQAEELPVLVMPGYSLRQTYELWEGATKRMRLCDGVDEELSGGACICNAEGNDRCDIYTRLVVALPELDTALGWRLISKGANAAHELPGMFALIERLSAGASFVPARLRIDQRRGVKDGQVVRFVVPVLDVGVGYAALAAGSTQRAILPAPEPPRYEPATQTSPSIEQALATVTRPRSSEPVGNQPDLPVPPFDPQPAPEPSPEELPATAYEPVGAEHASADVNAPQTKLATIAQKNKLNVLVGQLRDAGHIETDGLYKAIGQLRSMSGLDLAMCTPDYVDKNGDVHKAIDANGDTHWAPLRETLTRPEANQLIDWLQIKTERVAAEPTQELLS